MFEVKIGLVGAVAYALVSGVGAEFLGRLGPALAVADKELLRRLLL